MDQTVNQKMAQVKRESEEREAERRAKSLGLTYLDLRRSPIDVRAFKLVSEEEARGAEAAVIEEKGKNLTFVVFDPKNKKTADLIKKLESQNFKLKIAVGSLSGLEHVLESYKYISAAPQELAGALRLEGVRYADLRAKIKKLEDVHKLLVEFDFKTGKMADVLEDILIGAVILNASDVHFEPQEKILRIRYRIDGILHDVSDSFPAEYYHFLVSRIKLLSKIKINVTHEPQDGRFSIQIPESGEIEARISSIPSEFGETIVARLLYLEALNFTLSDLGFREDDLELIQSELKQPTGMILNTGPTGSGKTTTLYVFLRAKASPGIKIITIEKPIEYHLPGIEQTQVDEAAGYDFQSALKAVLRQDPDVILVGEINDEVTAEVALQAALTGHLVFSTVHANSAVAAIPRMLDLGVKPQSIGPAINLIISQRLLRKLCVNCRMPQKLDDAFKKRIQKFFAGLPKKVARKKFEDAMIYNPKGCAECGGFGYRGRIGIFEIFLVDSKVEKAIAKDATDAGLMDLARAQGMVTMQEDAILKVLDGVTSFEEVESATGPIAWGSD